MTTRGVLLDKRVLVRSGYDRFVERGFGEKHDEGLVLAPYEALYLAEKGKLEVLDEKGRKLSYEELARAFEERIPGFYLRYQVYKDLRDRGYVVRTGFKFGAHFRVYPRGKKPGEAHTEFTVQVFPEEERIELPELSRMVRLSRAIRTKLVLASIDAENEIVYYEIKRISP